MILNWGKKHAWKKCTMTKKLNKLKIKRPEPGTSHIQSISARLDFVSKVIVLIGEKQVPRLSYWSPATLDIWNPFHTIKKCLQQKCDSSFRVSVGVAWVYVSDCIFWSWRFRSRNNQNPQEREWKQNLILKLLSPLQFPCSFKVNKFQTIFLSLKSKSTNNWLPTLSCQRAEGRHHDHEDDFPSKCSSIALGMHWPLDFSKFRSSAAWFVDCL